MNSRDFSPSTRSTGELSAVERAGNRFGVTAVVFALLSTLCAVVPGMEQAAWALGPMGVVLGGAGLIRWLRNEATNRDDALIGAGLSYVVVMVLFFRLSVAYPIPVSGQFMMP